MFSELIHSLAHQLVQKGLLSPLGSWKPLWSEALFGGYPWEPARERKAGSPPSQLDSGFLHPLYANPAFLKFFFWLRKKIKSGKQGVPQRHKAREASVQRCTGERC